MKKRLRQWLSLAIVAAILFTSVAFAPTTTAQAIEQASTETVTESMDEEVSEHIAESAPETEPTETEENTLEESAEAEESNLEEKSVETEKNTLEKESAETEESTLEKESAETEESTLEEESAETEESTSEEKSTEAEKNTSEEESAEMEKGTPDVILAETEESTLGANATETKEIDASLTIDAIPVAVSEETDETDETGEVATFSKAAVSVCGGTIARKWLNGYDAFCLEEDKEYPEGATYYYKAASDAAYSGSVGWLTQHFASSGREDYAFSVHQAAIWAVEQGKTSYSEALEWARSYATSVHMSSGVDEYVEAVAELVTESQEQSAISYVYDPSNSANQRLILYDCIWGSKEVKKPDPWKAKVTLDKVDGVTGSRLTGNSTFQIYEWSAAQNQYVESTVYTMERQSDGTYSVVSSSDAYENGYLYYTDDNQGKFGIQETASPAGYLRDTQMSYFQMTEDGQTWQIGNEDPSQYAIQDSTKFANQPVWVRIRISKVDRYTHNSIQSDAVFTVYSEYGNLSTAVNFTRQSDGSYLSDKIYYADTVDNANYGKFYVCETKAPEGYYGDWQDSENHSTGQSLYGQSARNKVTYHFAAEADGSNHNTTITISNNEEGTFWNERQYGYVTLLKSDTEVDMPSEGDPITQGDGTALDGAVYGLYAAENIYASDGSTGLLYAKGELVQQETIGYSPVMDAFGYLLDEDGNRCVETGKEAMVSDTPGQTVFGQIELGSYYISEISPAPGYQLDTVSQHSNELTRYHATFTYQGEAVALIERDEYAREDKNTLTWEDDLDSHNIYSGDYVTKQAAQFVKIDDLENDSEGITIEGAGFTIYRISDLTGVKDGTWKPAEGSLWTKADIEKFETYDFTKEETPLIYKKASDTWSNGDTAWLVPEETYGENAYRVGEMFTDENGYLVTPELPIGQYVLIETTVPQGKVQADPILIQITTDSAAPQKTRYIKNESIQTYLRIVKTDSDASEEGNSTVLKAGAAYKILLLSDPVDFAKDNDNQAWKLKDGYLTCPDPYQTGVAYGTEEQPFAVQLVTDPATGKIVDAYIELPYQLPIGTYQLVEVQTPDGFVQNGYETMLVDSSDENQNGYELMEVKEDPVTFTISDELVYPDGQMGMSKYASADAYGNLTIWVEQSNKEQKGILQVTKVGEKLADYDNGTFTYALAPVEKASFAIYAAEDIYSQQIDSEQLDAYGVSLDDYLIWHQGDLVGTIETDENGFAYLGDLYIGTYEIQEIQAGDGFIRSTYVDTVTVTGGDNKVSYTVYDSAYENTRQKVSLSVIKTDGLSGEGLEGAVFGIYALEDIYSYICYDEDTDSYRINREGTLLVEAGTLLTTATTDETGTLQFDIDLPLGQYEIREIQAPEGYQMNEEVFEVDAGYQGQDGEEIIYLTVEVTDQPKKLRSTEEPEEPQQQEAPQQPVITPETPKEEVETGESDAVFYYGAICVISLLLAGGCLYRQRKKAVKKKQ